MTNDMALTLDRGRSACSQLLRKAEITAADVTALRRELSCASGISRAEADALFAIECAAMPKCREWTALFVEAITEHVVWQARPTGIVNETQGEWLITHTDEAASLNGLAVLVNILAEAHRVPLWFVATVRARAARNWSGVEATRAAA